MPDWAYFQASVDGTPYVFNLIDLASCYAVRKKNNIQPIHINPVRPEKSFDKRTLKRMFSKLDTLVEQEFLPKGFAVGWRDE